MHPVVIPSALEKFLKNGRTNRYRLIPRQREKNIGVFLQKPRTRVNENHYASLASLSVLERYSRL